MFSAIETAVDKYILSVFIFLLKFLQCPGYAHIILDHVYTHRILRNYFIHREDNRILQCPVDAKD